jgi:hypothetical protein
LCAKLSDVRRPDGESFLVRCPACGPFVIDRQLTAVIANARSRNVSSVLGRLRHLADLARAARGSGIVLTLTATNWVSIAASAGSLLD